MSESSKNEKGIRFSSLVKHLEGWQLGLLSVGLALLAAALVVPRPIAPDSLPMPEIDSAAFARSLTRIEGQARGALRAELPFDVRAVGEALRNYGAAVATGNQEREQHSLIALRQRTAVALKRHGPKPLLRLRAVQAHFFVRAVEADALGARAQDRDHDLEELGGDFLRKAAGFGWVHDSRLQLTRAECLTLFVVRWTRLTGLREHAAFMPTLDQWRVYYSLYLRSFGHTSGPAVAALSRMDPEYPSLLSAGIVHYRRGSTDARSVCLGNTSFRILGGGGDCARRMHWQRPLGCRVASFK